MADSMQVKEITAKLEQGVKDIFTTEKYAEYLKTMSRFHKYSTRNTLLIHLQMPKATLVAGYSSWQNKFGRHVKKGEKSIKIFAPVPFTKREEKEKLDPETHKPILGEDGMPIVEYTERQIARYRVVKVFDVSQTDGKPLPSLVQDLTGNVEQYEAFMDALKEISPLPIVFEQLPADTDGICRFGKEIAIRKGMSEIQTVCAAIHEITHAKLHDKESLRLTDENAKPKDRRTQEVEAESVSYAVCQYFGIETGANSLGYVAEWSKTLELKELNASLDTIRKTAAELIDAIDGEFQEIAKDRSISFAIGEQQVELAEPPEPAQSEVAKALPPEPQEFELGFGLAETGIAIWNWLDIRDGNGNEKYIAHVGLNGGITYLVDNLPDVVKADIEKIARGEWDELVEKEVEAINAFADEKDKRTAMPAPEQDNTPSESFEVTVFTYEDGGYDALAGVFDNRQDAEAFACLLKNDGYYAVGLKAISDGEVYQLDITVTLSEAQKNVKAVELFNKSKEETESAPEPEKPRTAELDMSLPDSLTTTAARNEYGYTDDGILPLSNLRAVELFDANHCIYLLYPDNTEAMALDRDEIFSFDGLCGIERAEWERSPVRAAQMAVAVNAEGKREADFLYAGSHIPENKFGIYQLRRDIDKARDYRFTPLEELNALGLSVSRANYELVYTAPFPERIEFLSDRYPVLNRIYKDFNIRRPDDFTGHSLSVSDVIVLKYSGNISSHYIDSTGYAELDGFLGDEQQQTIIAGNPTYDNGLLTLSQVGTRPEEYVGASVAQLESDANSGKVISLTDLANAMNAERKQGSNRSGASKPKLTLMERLEEGKRRAAVQSGQKSAPTRENDKEVRE